MAPVPWRLGDPLRMRDAPYSLTQFVMVRPVPFRYDILDALGYVR